MLIAGLGNPGNEYQDTRHNIGFAVVDELARRLRLSFSKKFKSDWAQDQSLMLLKPLTYMNLSGEAVGDAVRFFKIDAEKEVLVITDDLDLPVGALRLRLNGGSGGHNGLKSIIQHLGTESFSRLRIGIGRSDTLDSSDHVLSKISSGERALYEKIVQQAADGVEMCLKEGIAKAMNTVNQRSEKT